MLMCKNTVLLPSRFFCLKEKIFTTVQVFSGQHLQAFNQLLYLKIILLIYRLGEIKNGGNILGAVTVLVFPQCIYYKLCYFVCYRSDISAHNAWDQR